MENIINRIISLVTVIALIALTALFLTQKAFGSAPIGLQATIATSTFAYPVGTSASILFASSTCSARVVTTRDVAISMTFGDIGVLPTAVAGHIQAASTTVSYDSGLYGCGAVRAISTTVGATTVHVSETR